MQLRIDVVRSNHSVSWRLKYHRLRWRAGKKIEKFRGIDKKVYVSDRVELYKNIWRTAALQIPAKFIELAKGKWEIRYNDRATRINNYKVQLDDPVILELAGDKALCYSLFEKNGVPVPKHAVFKPTEIGTAVQFMKSNSGPFVVKPAVGTSAGRGVTTHIVREGELFKAAALASLYSDRILIERMIPGELYRLLFLDGKMIHASKRSGLKIAGDGKSTILELTSRALAGQHPQKNGLNLNRINNDLDFKITLAAQNLKMDSVLKNGSEVLVNSNGKKFGKGIETLPVYDRNVTQSVGKSIIDNAKKAVYLLGSEFAGVDCILIDDQAAMETSGGCVIEINTTPGLHHHYNLSKEDATESPALAVLRHLLGIDPSKVN